MEMVKYRLEQRGFLRYNYWGIKESCKKRFRPKYPSVRVSSPSTIFEMMMEVRQTVSFLDNKCTRQNAVIIDGKVDKIRPILGHERGKEVPLTGRDGP
jgi:hypothetical protein